MVSEILVSTVSGYALLPDDTKSLPEPMLKNIYLKFYSNRQRASNELKGMYGGYWCLNDRQQ